MQFIDGACMLMQNIRDMYLGTGFPKVRNKDTSLQTQPVYFTLKRRGNDRFHVFSTWNTSGVFVGLDYLDYFVYPNLTTP